MADEIEQVSHHLKQLVSKYSLVGKKIHDANLVASMLAFGIETILTNNPADFQLFDDLIEIEPLV